MRTFLINHPHSYNSPAGPVEKLVFSHPSVAPMIFDYYRAQLRAVAAYGYLFAAYSGADCASGRPAANTIIGCISCFPPGRDMLEE